MVSAQKPISEKNVSDSAIKPIIGHLKKDFRMEQKYLHKKEGILINALLAASAWNLKKLMQKTQREIFMLSVQVLFTMKKIYVLNLIWNSMKERMTK